jgi:hypothetical protein
MKRIVMLLSVGTLMVVMAVLMASAALAVPPASGVTGCWGGRTTPPTRSDTDGPHGMPKIMSMTPRKRVKLLGPRTTLG